MANRMYSLSAKWTFSSKKLGLSKEVTGCCSQLFAENLIEASRKIILPEMSGTVIDEDDCVLSCNISIAPIESASGKKQENLDEPILKSMVT